MLMQSWLVLLAARSGAASTSCTSTTVEPNGRSWLTDSWTTRNHSNHLAIHMVADDYLSLAYLESSRSPSGRGDGGESGGQQGCCAQVLDSKGRHAVTCPVGGKTIHRHDFISSRLANLLKPFAISVNTEVYVHELEQVCPETGQ